MGLRRDFGRERDESTAARAAGLLPGGRGDGRRLETRLTAAAPALAAGLRVGVRRTARFTTALLTGRLGVGLDGRFGVPFGVERRLDGVRLTRRRPLDVGLRPGFLISILRNFGEL